MRAPATAGSPTLGRWRGWRPWPSGAEEDQALVLSTGVIGHYMPMDKIERGFARGSRSSVRTKTRWSRPRVA